MLVIPWPPINTRDTIKEVEKSHGAKTGSCSNIKPTGYGCMLVGLRQGYSRLSHAGATVSVSSSVAASYAGCMLGLLGVPASRSGVNKA